MIILSETIVDKGDSVELFVKFFELIDNETTFNEIFTHLNSVIVPHSTLKTLHVITFRTVQLCSKCWGVSGVFLSLVALAALLAFR